MNSKPIYLDYNATTPLDPMVLEAMIPYLRDNFANADSNHLLGRSARDAVERARALVAELIGAAPQEIYFTSGATESDNMAVRGVAAKSPGSHIVTSIIEHKAVVESCRHAEQSGHPISWLRPDRTGTISLDLLKSALRPTTKLVSLMWVNNEVGTVNPIEAIGAHLRDKKILFHTDAAQGLGFLPLDVQAAGVDLASISAHKLYGPKGIGALYVREEIRGEVAPHTSGGGHERSLRPGTLNVPAIVGFGEACRIARLNREVEARRITALRNELWHRFESALPGIAMNGALENRAPGNLNVAFDFVDARKLTEALEPDMCVSQGSACTSRKLEPSHVLMGIGLGGDRARSSIRLSLGRFTTAEDISKAANLIISAVRRLRDASPLWRSVGESVATAASPRGALSNSQLHR